MSIDQFLHAVHLFALLLVLVGTRQARELIALHEAECRRLRKQVDDQATQIDLLKQRERDLARQLRPLRVAHSLQQLEAMMRTPHL